MSDGLRFLSSALSVGSSRSISEADREFFLDNELTVYDFVKSHLRTYRELPSLVTVQEETGVRMPVAHESLDFYFDQLTARHEYSVIREHYSELRESLKTQDMESITESVETMARVVRRSRRTRRNSGELSTMGEAFNLVADRLVRIRGTGGVSGIQTSWPSFDMQTGGYQNSDLITWVARPELGKTYMLLRQVKAAHVEGRNILFVTTEMGTEQIARRYAAIELGLNPTYLKSGMVSTHVQRRIAALSTSFTGADRLHILSVGMNAKVENVLALIEEIGPDIAFIDGVYLLRPSEMGRNANRTEKVTQVFDELKAANLAADIPFVVTTQFNRVSGKGGKDGTLETVGFSDAIGTHSSIVVAIKHGPTEDPKASRYIEFLKGREGESGKIAINFKFAPLDMDEFVEEEGTMQHEEGEPVRRSVDWMMG